MGALNMVLSMYKWHRVIKMKEEGIPIKRIAKQLKLSKNTVKKYLNSGNPPKRVLREYKLLLDRFKDDLDQMIEKRFIGSRIIVELTKRGYEGCEKTVYRYLENIKKEEKIKQKATTRFETQPGYQMQYDWKEWDLPVGDRIVSIYIHGCVLSYSRFKSYSWSLKVTTEDIIRAIEESLRVFEGVPKELLIDNPKQMVITHKASGIVRYNDEFLKFCGLYKINPEACENYRARTKGKIERPFYYVQEHLLRGLVVESLGEFDRFLKEFTNDYNQREHSSLKEKPIDRFVREKEYLQKMATIEPTILYNRTLRKVSNDGYISFAGRFYPVPMSYCLQDVMVEQVFGKSIRIYALKGELIQESSINENGYKPEHPAHKILNDKFEEKKKRATSLIVEKFELSFPHHGPLFIQGLKDRHGKNAYWQLEEILEWEKIYSQDSIEKALKECLEMHAFHKSHVRRSLETKKMCCPQQIQVRNYYPQFDIKRPLSSYKVEA